MFVITHGPHVPMTVMSSHMGFVGSCIRSLIGSVPPGTRTSVPTWHMAYLVLKPRLRCLQGPTGSHAASHGCMWSLSFLCWWSSLVCPHSVMVFCGSVIAHVGASHSCHSLCICRCPLMVSSEFLCSSCFVWVVRCTAMSLDRGYVW